MEDIRPAFDSGDLTVMVLIDFSKAFDSICFKLLIKKLKKFFEFGQLVSSYLADRSQYVSSLSSSSKLSCIHSGVPQGSILGPILFSIHQ